MTALFGAQLPRTLGHPVLIDDTPGASGAPGPRAARAFPADISQAADLAS